MKCEICNNEHDGYYGTGRFCSVRCSNTYSSSQYTPTTKIVQCIMCGVDIEVSSRASSKLCKCDGCRIRNKYSTGKIKIDDSLLTEKCCNTCDLIKPVSEFYTRKLKHGFKYYNHCKTCSSKKSLERQQKIKKLDVEYKGGKCVRCGYDTYTGALEFHHRDPLQKDFGISTKSNVKFNDVIKKRIR